MKTMLWMVLSTVFGAVGWWIGEYFGFTTAFVLSTVGSLVGVYAGIKIARNYLE